MKINIYGYNSKNRLVAVSEVGGDVDNFINNDLLNDAGKTLLVEALMTAGDNRKNEIHKCLVSITGSGND